MFGFDIRNIGFLGAASAAVVAGVYVLWGPTDRRKKTRKKETCPGLINMGNTCFLNAILQALAPCNSMVHWLGDFIDKQCQRQKDYTKCLAYTLIKILKVLNNDVYEDEIEDEHCPSEVVESLRTKRWIISTDEQDAHELLHVLTETLEEEATKFPRVLSLFDLGNLQHTGSMSHGTVGRCRGQLPSLPTREGDLPFRGLLASQLQCRTCAYKCPVKYDKFDSLSLTLPDTPMGSVSVERLLRNFISSETVQNVDCEGCAKIQERGPDDIPKRSFVKRLTIGKLPACLCMHIQRTVWLNSGEPMKRFEHVEFPEMLYLDDYVYNKRQGHTQYSTSASMDLGIGLFGGRKGLNGFKNGGVHRIGNAASATVPYSRPLSLLKALNYNQKAKTNLSSVEQTAGLAEDTGVQHMAQAFQAASAVVVPHGENVYKLTAVVAHLGEVFSGHFITYRRAPASPNRPFSDKWLYTSDTVVRKTTLLEVLGTSAYMLFYERV